jgi:hypothetical protein
MATEGRCGDRGCVAHREQVYRGGVPLGVPLGVPRGSTPGSTPGSRVPLVCGTQGAGLPRGRRAARARLPAEGRAAGRGRSPLRPLRVAVISCRCGATLVNRSCRGLGRRLGGEPGRGVPGTSPTTVANPALLAAVLPGATAAPSWTAAQCRVGAGGVVVSRCALRLSPRAPSSRPDRRSCDAAAPFLSTGCARGAVGS